MFSHFKRVVGVVVVVAILLIARHAFADTTTTTLPAGCVPGALFSTITGQPCTTGVLPANQPVGTVIGTPTLKLTYDSVHKESQLQANATVSIKAGNSDAHIPLNYGVYITLSKTTINNGDTEDNSIVTSFTPVQNLSIGGDNITVVKYYIIPAGTTAQFNVVRTDNPQQLFAGTYFASLLNVVALNSQNLSYSVGFPTNISNGVTIVGEGSPHQVNHYGKISSITSGDSFTMALSAGQPVPVKLAPLASVTLNSKTTTLTSLSAGMNVQVTGTYYGSDYYSTTFASLVAATGVAQVTQTSGCVGSAMFNNLTGAPCTSILSGNSTTSLTPTISGTADGVTQVGVVLGNNGGKVYGSGLVAVVNGKWSVTVSPALTAGIYTVTVYDASNDQLANGTLTVAPTVTTTPTTPVDHYGTISSVNVSGNSMVMALSANQPAYVVVTPSTTITLNSKPAMLSSLAPGMNVHVRGTYVGSDRYSTTTATLIEATGSTVTTVIPTVTSITPASGPIGTMVTVTGTGFGPTGNILHFGPILIPGLNSTSGTSLTFPVPPSGVTNICVPGVICAPSALLLIAPGIYQVSSGVPTSNSPVFTVTQPTVPTTVTLSTDQANPVSGKTYVNRTSGAQGVILGIFDVTASGQNAMINTVSFNLGTTQTLPTAAYLYSGSILVSSVSVPSTKSISFSNLSLPLIAGTVLPLNVRIDMPGNTASGSVVSFGPSVNVAYKDSTGVSSTVTGTVTSNPMTFSSVSSNLQITSTPVATIVSTSQNGVTTAIQAVFNLKVTPQPGQEVQPVSSDFQICVGATAQNCTPTSLIAITNIMPSPTSATSPLSQGTTYTFNVTAVAKASTLPTGQYSFWLTQASTTVNDINGNPVSETFTNLQNNQSNAVAVQGTVSSPTPAVSKTTVTSSATAATIMSIQDLITALNAKLKALGL